MKTLIARLLLACLIVVALAGASVMPAAALESFTIGGYDIQMNVNADNSYDIVETIDVSFQSDFMHGIYREIPDKTYNGNPARVKNISMSGSKYTMTRGGGMVTIRIGDPNQYASRSEHYVIRYTYEIGEDKLSEIDELYFNLIGADWNTYISGVKFKITMPYQFDATKLNFTYGRTGSTTGSSVKYAVAGNVITGSIDAKLGPYEALTVALPLPQGYYDQAKVIKTFGDYLQQYFPLFFGLIAALGLIVWFALGRNKKIIPVVEFNPPPGMTSADIGYIYDAVVNPYDITSLIIYWAGKGCLAIEETESAGLLTNRKNYRFVKLAELPAGSKNYEKVMFNDLFNEYGDGTSVEMDDLRNQFYKTVNTVKSLIKDQYAYPRDARVFETSGPFAAILLQLLGFAAAYLMAFGLFFKISSAISSESYIVAIFIGLLIYVPLNLIAHAIFKWKTVSNGKRAAYVLSAAGLMFVLWLVLSMYVWRVGLTAFMIAGLAVSFVLALLSRYCVKRTALGNEYQSRLLGLRDFMLNAEMDRIKALADETPQYFYKVLPFAIAFGIADKWADRFSGITTEPPDWYRYSGQPGVFNTILFTHMLNDDMHHVSAAMTSMPSQSSGGFGGSVGGGFSGGGSGGGGGGGW